MMKTFNWATLGCGVIANELAQAMQSRGQKLYSVANRTHEKAVAFAEKYGIEKVYNSIDELFEDENVDIKNNRLALLEQAKEVTNAVGDLSCIVL